ncbi:MAG: hypothetical protein D6775_05395 [Caldilineae bacterium]|nr:MAG: hypothetical protein D6775_05395 [Caldilineae bacterium]
MDFITTLRFIHIFLAIFWVGTTFFLTLFLEPTIERAGQAGGQVMQTLITSTRFSPTIALSGWGTILAGLLLFWRLHGFDVAEMFGPHLPLTLGATAGILSGFVGTFMQGRSAGKLKMLAQEMAAQGGPPTPEQMATVHRLQATVSKGSRISAVLMVIAVIGMVV